MKIKLLISSGILCSLLLTITLEIWLRLKLPKSCVLRHPLLHHAFRPNCQTTETNQDYSMTYKYNSVGLRDKDYNPSPEPGKFRIIMLGDSFTEGVGVADKDTFSTLIENQIDTEVINAGVRKYAPLLEYLYLKSRGPELKPNLVVLNLNATDLIETDKYHQSIIRDSNGEIIKVTAPGRHFLPLSLRIFLWNNSRLYGYFQERVFPTVYKTYQAVKSGSSQNQTKPIYSDRQFNMFSLFVDPAFETEYQKLSSLIFEDLAVTKQLLDRHNIPLLIVIQPTAIDVTPDEWKDLNGSFSLPLKFPDDYPIDNNYYRDLERYLNHNDIPFINLIDAFRQNSSPENLLFFPHDGHWNAKGHAVAAKEISDYILKNYEK